MHPREKLLGMVELYRKRNQPIPVDLLAQADALGLVLAGLEDPQQSETTEGEFQNDYEEDDLPDV